MLKLQLPLADGGGGETIEEIDAPMSESEIYTSELDMGDGQFQ